jgi:hypothetical protein
MSPLPGKQSGLTFQQIAARLPKDKLERLAEIKKAYPHIPLERLPDTVKHEVKIILQIGINASPAAGQTAQYSGTTGAQPQTPIGNLYSVIGTDINNNEDVAIYQKDRPQGLYIIGTTGTGKSTLIATLILTDINQGLGVCLIEPHGDLTKSVLSCIPDSRLPDVVLLDLMDTEYPFGLNIFECRDAADIIEVAKTVSFVFHVFEKMWGVGPGTPRLAQVLRNVTQTLIENPGTTFGEIPFLFWNEEARNQLVSNVKNQQVRLFWERYNQRSRRDREEYVESTDNKVDAYLSNDQIRHIVSQAKTSIDFRKIMDEGKILLILLSPQLEEISRLIGSVLIGKLLMAAFSRVDTDEDKRRQFNLYCDEYQRFATSDFRSFIDEARKFKVAITLSHQSLSQLDEENRTAATGAANMIAFRVSGEDGKELAKNFDTTPTQAVVGEEPVRAPVADVISHLVNKGHNDERVTRFAQRYLQRLEDFVDKKYDQYPPHEGDYDTTYITGADIRKGRELLNDCLYRCMSRKSASFQVAPLAIYILAYSQFDGLCFGIDTFINRDWWPFGPKYLRGFKDQANRFGSPEFIEDDCIEGYLSLFKEKERAGPRAVVEMIRDLRHTMRTLTDYPVEVDTGQYKPKLQPRQHLDMENEIANSLSQRPDFQAKVRMRSGEYDIQTNQKPSGISGSALTVCIDGIKRRMRREGHCRSYLEVEREISERQERWKDRGTRGQRPGGPPPTYT